MFTSCQYVLESYPMNTFLYECILGVLCTYYLSFFITAAKTGVPFPNWYDSEPWGCECQTFDPRMSGLPCKLEQPNPKGCCCSAVAMQKCPKCSPCTIFFFASPLLLWPTFLFLKIASKNQDCDVWHLHDSKTFNTFRSFPEHILH